MKTLVGKIAWKVNWHLTRHTPIKQHPSRLNPPIASVTFDDFPRSAWTGGQPLLAKYGAKATYYVAGSFSGRNIDGLEYFIDQDLIDLNRAGHEIGNHTFAHWNVRDQRSRSLLED